MINYNIIKINQFSTLNEHSILLTLNPIYFLPNNLNKYLENINN